MRKKLFMITTLLLLIPHTAEADLDVIREVIIAPKNGRAAANIGSVNQSSNIRMVLAKVDIEVGKVPVSDQDPVRINVHSVFTMKNESQDALSLTVGFPVSRSEYSAFDLVSFAVKTDGNPRSVFNRVSGYIRRIKHIFISGPDKESYKKLVDYEINKDHLEIYGIQKIGKGEYQNLMVWGEVFDPGQERNIEVRYSIEIPLQKNVWKQKKVKGNYKGIWPQEANNLPLDFLKSIPGKKKFSLFSYNKYYFFDYYLISGASWKGTIGEEVITLRLDNSWQGHTLYSNHKDKLVRQSSPKGDDLHGILTYAYILRNAEPTGNLYFALKRP